MNPLFAPDDDQPDVSSRERGYVVSNRHGRTIQPIHGDLAPVNARSQSDHKHMEQPNNPAVNLIRQKLEALYEDEPSAREERKEATATPASGRSKHQQYMYELSTSGKSLAEIQTAWHSYYTKLPDNQKHEVWQEFYANNSRTATPATKLAATQGKHEATLPAPAAKPENIVPLPSSIGKPRLSNAVSPAATIGTMPTPNPTKHDRRSTGTIKKHIKKTAALRDKMPERTRQHVKSLLFGLSTGGVVLLVVLFSFFNEVVIAPFIQPSQHASATPIILSDDGVAPTSSPEVIIPKINVEIPVDYTQTSNDENTIENALEDGVVHYPSTVMPGQKGNAAIFGHSSNNIFNPGKYKFAFVLLHDLVPGDIFYLTYNSKVYTYKVYDKQVVDPSNVSVLNNVADKTATATLITCDPPGTSLHRLVVWGEQVSPDPNGNADASASSTTTSSPSSIAGNGPTLWKRLTGWLF